jgi:DnaJ family protein C protein 28
MADKSVDEEIKIKAQQARRLARYMSSTEDLVENQILKAQP